MTFWYYCIALVTLNLISLWVDSGANSRIILLSLSLYGHFTYMELINWSVPYNGDSVPDIGKGHSNQLRKSIQIIIQLQITHYYLLFDSLIAVYVNV